MNVKTVRKWVKMPTLKQIRDLLSESMTKLVIATAYLDTLTGENKMLFANGAEPVKEINCDDLVNEER